jgi:hypothetical protein
MRTPRRRVDLTRRSLAPPAGTALAGELAAALAAGALVEAEVFAAEGAAELLGEIVAVQAAHFDPAADAYSQLLVAPGRTIFNWGTGGEEGAAVVDLAAHPRLARLTADALALAGALARPEDGGEAPLLSVVPSIRKTRSFPRFYHRDSHASVAEVADEGGARAAPSCYRMVWDLGLAGSCEVLDVDFVPRAALLDAEGRVRPEHLPLFQRRNLDFRAMTDAEIDAVQPQMREELLPFPERREGRERRERRKRRKRRKTASGLRPGRAFIWLDDLFFHTTYLRRGRSVAELGAAPRSILIVRGFAGGAWRAIPWSPAVRRLLA